ncbi:uncharacterized protein N7515_003497 [Penicillium bovifimosum]|uniref:Uncharacterized protein n=1 Tax=Penicillium bovifimosum TaxID=126998 RepID=A0A9W9H643_9EURO|nr:uncharacterized protein N7515_003497 [Penicillium bovifimosum]KAJ5138649.1 hypothetical protein N7515_003497 [Penicillium bovifimosum]
MSFTFSSRVFLRSSTYLFSTPAKRTLSSITSLSTCCTGQAVFASRLEKIPYRGTKPRTRRFPRVRGESLRPFSSTSATAWRGFEDSKRTPWRRLQENTADLIEGNLETDGFSYWGITMYRTTYKSDADWAKFLDRFMGSVRTELESHDGLDMLDSFRPVVMEDARRFDGATPDQIRDAFKEWARVACETEHGVPYKHAEKAYSARYRLCIMVDEEALQSVLDIPTEDLEEYNTTGFVILIDGRWSPELDPEELAAELAAGGGPDDGHGPVYGCTLGEVGWMKVEYAQAQTVSSALMTDDGDWDVAYRRPPAIGFDF